MTKELTFTNGLLTNASGSSLNNPSTGARAYTFINGILTNVGQVLPGVTPSQLNMTFTNGLLTNYYIVSGSSTGGCAWTEHLFFVDDGYVMCATDADGSYFVAGSYNNIAHSTDSGSNWSFSQPATTNGNNDIASSGTGQYVIMCENIGRLYLSSNYGDSWGEVGPSVGTNNRWSKVAINSTGNFMMACHYKISGGETEGVFISTNYGSSWSEVSPAGVVAEPTWTSVACDDDGSVLMACSNQRLYISTNSGSSWTEARPNGDADYFWYSNDCNSDGSIMVSLYRDTGRLWLSIDTGSNWSEIRPNGDISYDWRDVRISKDGQVISVCDIGPIAGIGALWNSRDRGVSWKEVSPTASTTKNFYKIDMNDTGTSMIVIELNGSMYTGTCGSSSGSSGSSTGSAVIIASGSALPWIVIDAVNIITLDSYKEAISGSTLGLVEGKEYYIETTGGPHTGRDASNRYTTTEWLTFAFQHRSYTLLKWNLGGRLIVDWDKYPVLNTDKFYDGTNQISGSDLWLFNQWTNTNGYNSKVNFIYHSTNGIRFGTLTDPTLYEDAGSGDIAWELGTVES